MTNPIPISIASVQQKAAQQDAKKALARQIMSQDRLEESMETGFNPSAANRQQGRMNRFKGLEDRKKTESDTQKVEAVAKKGEEDLAKDFFRRNPELPADKLRQMRQALRQGASPQEVLEKVTRAFEDPTLADEVMEYLERTTDGELLDSVKQARMIHYEQKEREILAGRNIDTAAKSFHKKGIGEDPTELRELYRDITGNPRDHNTLFSDLSEKYPFDQLQMVTAFLLKGLGYDLKSKGPSIQQAELMMLMTETRNLQSILWVYLFFKSRMGLISSLFTKYGLRPSHLLNFEFIAKQFIRFVEQRYPSILKLLKQVEEYGLLDDLEKAIVLSQYRDAIRHLSPRLYKSVKHRQELLLVILETLEELETEEEEEDA